MLIPLLQALTHIGSRKELDVVEALADRSTTLYLPKRKDPQVRAAAERAYQAITARIELAKQRANLLRPADSQSEELLRPVVSSQSDPGLLLHTVEGSEP